MKLKIISLVLCVVFSFTVYADETGSIVKSIIAKQLDIESVLVNENSTIKNLGGDALDVMELVMLIEENFGISISDDALVENGSKIEVTEFPKLLTVKRLISVAKNSPKNVIKENDNQVVLTNTIQDGEVGAYGEISKKDNPNNYQLVFIPAFEDILEYKQVELKRPLTDQEIVLIKNESTVIAFPKELASQFLDRRKKN